MVIFCFIDVNNYYGLTFKSWSVLGVKSTPVKVINPPAIVPVYVPLPLVKIADEGVYPATNWYSNNTEVKPAQFTWGVRVTAVFAGINDGVITWTLFTWTSNVIEFTKLEFKTLNVLKSADVVVVVVVLVVVGAIVVVVVVVVVVVGAIVVVVVVVLVVVVRQGIPKQLA